MKAGDRCPGAPPLPSPRQSTPDKDVGFEEVDDGEWDLYFGPMKVGRFHERLRRVEDARGNLARKNLKV